MNDANRNDNASYFGWEDKLAVGKAGEEQVLPWLERQFEHVSDVRGHPYYRGVDVDFICDGWFLELKTDERASETGRLFFEQTALAKTTAHFWLVLVPGWDALYIFITGQLRRYLARSGHPLVRVGKPSRKANGETWDPPLGQVVTPAVLGRDLPTVAMRCIRPFSTALQAPQTQPAPGDLELELETTVKREKAAGGSGGGGGGGGRR